MRHDFRLSVLGVSCAMLFVTASASTALGQANWQKPPDMAAIQKKIKETKVTETEGPLAGIQGQMVMLTNFANEPIMVMLTPETRISVTGLAETTALKSGMAIRFMGTVDEAGKLAAPIKEMEIYTPYPVPPEDIAPGTEAQFSGKLTKFKDGEFQMQVTSAKKIKRLSGQIDPAAKITLSLTDLSVVSQGDKVKLSGKNFEGNKWVAEQITIELAQPVTGGKRKPAPKAEPSKNAPEKTAEKPAAEVK